MSEDIHLKGSSKDIRSKSKQDRTSSLLSTIQFPFPLADRHLLSAAPQGNPISSVRLAVARTQRMRTHTGEAQDPRPPHPGRSRGRISQMGDMILVQVQRCGLTLLPSFLQARDAPPLGQLGRGNGVARLRVPAFKARHVAVCFRRLGQLQLGALAVEVVRAPRRRGLARAAAVARVRLEEVLEAGLDDPFARQDGGDGDEDRGANDDQDEQD